MSGIWGEEIDVDPGRAAATRLYVGAIRSIHDELVLITRLDRANSIAEVQSIPQDALLKPEWWLTNEFNSPTKTEVTWKQLDRIPSKLDLETRVWPPMPVLFSGAIPDFTAPDSIRKYAPKVLSYLMKCADSSGGVVHHDSFLVLPKLYGAPHLAWHRDGHCIVGINLLNTPAPSWYHDKNCPRRSTMEPPKSDATQGRDTEPNGARPNDGPLTSGRQRRYQVFREYINEAERVYKRLLRQSMTAPSKPARIIEVYLEEQCHCASVPTSEQAPIAILTNSTLDLGQAIDEKAGMFIRRLSMLVGNHDDATRRRVNEHARRLTRYGLTAVRKEPRTISKEAKEEIRKKSQSSSRNMIRFGPAGSGKTSLLAELAARLSRQGKRVAVVTFTHASRKVVESRVENETIANRALIDYFKVTELLPSASRNRAIDKAMRSLRQLDSADFTRRMFAESTNGIDAESEDQLPKQEYQALLVDEAEDFTSEMWEYLLGRDESKNWVAGRNLQLLCVAFDDAQAVLGGLSAARSFESQAPTQWSRLAFDGQVNPADLRVRAEFISPVDFQWLGHNLRQMPLLANTTSAFRTKFRRADPPINSGFIGPDTATAISLKPSTMDDMLNAIKEQCASTEDVIVVCPDRLMVAAATLWLDHPGQFVTQSEFIEDPEYAYAEQRGDRKTAGVWFEAPVPRTQPVKTLNGEMLFQNIKAENVCSIAHQQLVRLDQASKLSVSPTDSRARILTFAAARGHEADTAVILIPQEDWFPPELKYIGMTRPQQKLVTIEVPRLVGSHKEDESEAGRLLAALEVLRIGEPSTAAIWPRLQIDVWHWRREEGVKYLEQEAPRKILDWWAVVQKELSIKPEWFGKTHCLDSAFARVSANHPPAEDWRDYQSWVKKITDHLAQRR